MNDFPSLDRRFSNTLRFIERTVIVRQAAIFLAHSADPWNCLIALALLWFWGNEYWKTRALVLFAGTLITAAVVFVIKYTVRRQRPQGEWGNIYRLTNPHSFPSGHAARCVMLALLGLALAPQWFGLLLLACAVLVALARVGMGVHYLSDVLVGALIGVLVGWLTLLLYLEYKDFVFALLA